jgi:activator of HSP90 ATPase
MAEMKKKRIIMKWKLTEMPLSELSTGSYLPDYWMKSTKKKVKKRYVSTKHRNGLDEHIREHLTSRSKKKVTMK